MAEVLDTETPVPGLVDLVLSLQVPERLSEDWIEFFDEIGAHDNMVYASPVFAESGLSQSIAEAYLRYPNRTGLMAWLEAASYFRELPSIPSEHLNFSEGDSLQVQRRKLVLRLARGQPARDNFSILVGKAAEVLAFCPNRSTWRVLRMLAKFRGEDWVGRFTIELMAKLNSMGEQSLVDDCVQSVVEWLSFRKSPLHDASAVKSLGLEGLSAE